MHGKASAGGGPGAKPAPPWLAGAAIGLAILGMASGAIAFGAGMALTQSVTRDVRTG
ncbi:MAG TPA: hypothetical protein VMB73_24475 [Acetobacteraceae bacterium]|jgi:hypothetical protein|nr:hypothetical protein [Acetobacteraceae bacterium]